MYNRAYEITFSDWIEIISCCLSYIGFFLINIVREFIKNYILIYSCTVDKDDLAYDIRCLFSTHFSIYCMLNDCSALNALWLPERGNINNLNTNFTLMEIEPSTIVYSLSYCATIGLVDWYD